jgi:serine/threonine-protein kinase RsbW
MNYKEQMCMTLKNDLSEIERMSQLLAEFGERWHLPAKPLLDLNLAIEEVVANVITHGYEDYEEHQIGVTISLEDKDITVKVEDDGRPFNPLEFPEPDLTRPLEEKALGGLGIHLVRNLTDGLDYKRQQAKNLLVMKKIMRG